MIDTPKYTAAPDQGLVFLRSEGDAYYERNAAANADYDPRSDVVAKAIEGVGFPLRADRPRAILDLGCSSGERLSHLRVKYRASGWGFDASNRAIREAAERDPLANWITKDWTATPDPEVDDFDIVISSYVWHWVDRRYLLRAMAAVQHYTAVGGFLILNDWVMTDDVPYAHAPGVVTYKRDYPRMFLATGCFKERYRLSYTYKDTVEPAACVVLERVV